MYYVIQENVFRERHYDKLIEDVNRLGLEYEIVNLRPFTNNIEKVITERTDVMVFGAVKLARIAKKYNWKPGSFMSDKHDYDYYSGIYKDYLFNYDSKIISYYDKEMELPEIFFARPTKDTKAFTGQVFTREEFEVTRGVLKRNGWVNADFNIQIAKPKRIHSEARFWIVDGKVITGSYYMRGGKYFTEEIKDGDIWNFVEVMLKKEQIAKAFVIDICQNHQGDYRIMELGCINCAGFYEADMKRVIIALEDLYKD